MDGDVTVGGVTDSDVTVGRAIGVAVHQGGPVAHLPGDCSGGNTRASSASVPKSTLSWHARRRLDRPAAQDAHRLRLGTQRLDCGGEGVLGGGTLDVQEELIAAEAAPKRPGLDPGEVDLMIRE